MHFAASISTQYILICSKMLMFFSIDQLFVLLDSPAKQKYRLVKLLKFNYNVFKIIYPPLRKDEKPKMKFFHLSDLHIGLKLINRDLSADQKHIFEQITALAKENRPDALVIAGDIYDRSAPSAEAVELFDNFVTSLSETLPDMEIMMISGNHDSAQRVDCFRRVLLKHNIYMIGTPPKTQDEYIEKVVLEDEYGRVNFYLLPFVKPSVVRAVTGVDENGNSLSYNDALHMLIGRENINSNERNVIVSHQFYLPKGKKADDVERMDSEIRTVGNIDEVCADVLEQFDYAALGHIHKPMKAGSETVRYCGTPLACSVSEAEQEKGIIMVDMGEKGNVRTSVLPLKPLRAVRVIEGVLEDVLEKGCEDYVTVVLCGEEDLDVFDMQERLRLAFPNLLEIRRKNARRAEYKAEPEEREILNPFELCCEFAKLTDDEEKKILQEALNAVCGRV